MLLCLHYLGAISSPNVARKMKAPIVMPLFLIAITFSEEILQVPQTRAISIRYLPYVQ